MLSGQKADAMPDNRPTRIPCRNNRYTRPRTMPEFTAKPARNRFTCFRTNT